MEIDQATEGLYTVAILGSKFTEFSIVFNVGKFKLLETFLDESQFLRVGKEEEIYLIFYKDFDKDFTIYYQSPYSFPEF